MTLQKRIKSRERMLGVVNFSGSAHMIEIMGALSFDFVMIDLEHTVHDVQTMAHLVRAASSFQLPSIVRLPETNPALIMKALDCGADGLVIPRVNSASDIEAALRAASFPPNGTRGMCPDIRAARYSFEGWADHARAVEFPLVIPLVEDERGVESIEEIVAVPGVDMVYFGPADYGMSIAGRDGFDDRVQRETSEALDRIVRAAHARNIAVASTPLFGLDDSGQVLDDLHGRGVDTVIYSTDTSLFRTIAQKIKTTFDKQSVGLEKSSRLPA